MNANNLKLSLLMVMTLAAAAANSVFAAEDSNAPPAAEYTNMGHSRADGKAMRLMPKPGSGGQATTPDGKVEYSHMGHSPGDAKAMRSMKRGQRTDTKEGTAVEYSTMGHSPGDAKSMRTMKEPATSVTVKEGASATPADTPK